MFDNENKEFSEHLVTINRVAKVVKGGRRFGFAAIMIVGDNKGRVGYGTGKAKEVPEAVRQGVRPAVDAGDGGPGCVTVNRAMRQPRGHRGAGEKNAGGRRVRAGGRAGRVTRAGGRIRRSRSEPVSVRRCRAEPALRMMGRQRRDSGGSAGAEG